MKSFFKHFTKIIIGSVLLLIIWIFSLQIAEQILPSQLETAEVNETLALALLFAASFLHVIIVYAMIRLSGWYGIKLIVWTGILIYGIQYFLSMIEALWFNDSLDMPITGIYNLLISGIFMAFVFSPIIVWLGGKFQKPSYAENEFPQFSEINGFTLKVILLSCVAYPLIYFLAGYFIAWQFESVRIFYSGEIKDSSFFPGLINNIKSGLYFFQIIRGLFWIFLGYYTFQMLEATVLIKGIIIGFLFAILMNAGHLIPNPYFPAEVSLAHFIETFSSNFIWGVLLAFVIDLKNETGQAIKARISL